MIITNKPKRVSSAKISATVWIYNNQLCVMNNETETVYAYKVSDIWGRNIDEVVKEMIDYLIELEITR